MVTGGGHDNSVGLWRLDASQRVDLVKRVQFPARVYAADVSPCGRWIAACCTDGTVNIISTHVATGEERKVEHTASDAVLHSHDVGGTLWRVAFNKNAKWPFVAVGSDSKYAVVMPYDPQTGALGEPVARLLCGGIVYCVEFSVDGRHLAAASGGANAVFLYDLDEDSGEWVESGTLQGHTDWPYYCAWSLDGSRLATGCNDNVARVFDVASRELLVELKAHTDTVRSVRFGRSNPDLLVSCSDDGKMILWDLHTAEALEECQPHGGRFVIDAAFSPVFPLLFTTSTECIVRVHDTIPALTGGSVEQLYIFAMALESPDSDAARYLAGNEAYDRNVLRLIADCLRVKAS